MTFANKIKKLNKTLDPYYSLIIMIIFFVGLLIGVYEFFFKRPNLSVKIERQDINYPTSINEKFRQTVKFILDSTRNTDVKANAITVHDYLLNTDNFWVVTLKNETRHTLTNIRSRIANVSTLTSYGIASPFLLDEERDKLMKNLTFQESSGIIYIDKIEELPAKTELKIYLWGKLRDLSFGDNVFITYEGGDAKPAKTTTVTGFKAYLIEYIFEIFILFIMVLIVIYRNIVKKYQRAVS